MTEHESWKRHKCPDGEPIPGKTYRADGWAYYDAPVKSRPEIWDGFLALIGSGNYIVLAESSGPDWKRGQLLISPIGADNILAHKLQAAS